MELYSSDIKNYMSATDFLRGVEYYTSGHVTKCLVKVDTSTKLMLLGNVKGSYNNSYAQIINIDRSNELKIVGDCTCPVRHNCKHVTAVCLNYIINSENNKTLEDKKNDKLEYWLGSLEAREDKKDLDELKDTPEYFITYRLFGKYKGRDELKFYKTKYLKNGNLSQGTYLDSYRFVDTYYFDDLKNNEDREICDIAKNMEFDRWSTMRFQGVIGAILLQDILKTNRCYYDENKEALRLSEERFKPEFDFKLYNGEYSLKSNIDKNYKILETKPPYILEIKSNMVYELDIDLGLFKKLTDAPKIPKESLGKVYKKIGAAVTNIEFKTPKGIKSKILDLKPIPQLHLNSKSFKIDFDYSGYEIRYEPRSDSAIFYEENEKVDIKRDLDFEEAVKRRVEDIGFEVQIKDSDICVDMKESNKQKQLKAFKKLYETDLEILQKQGWCIKNIDDSGMKFEANSEVVVESENENDWFSLSFNLEFNGVSQPIAPLVSGIINEFDNLESMPELVNLEVDDNHFVEVQTKQIAPIIKTIIELMDKKDKDDNLKVSNFDAHMIASLDDSITWKGSREILELSKKLKDFKGIKKVKPPKALSATLRDYQQDGLNWLGFLHEFKFGGILADDMGLGKTIQTLTHLSKLKEDGKLDKPSLIVMPTSLIANWKNEAKRFTPNLNVLSLHGNDRDERFHEVNNNDILLTTYALIIRDKEKFDKLKFSYIILDEAQKIKNPKTKMAVAIKEFKSEYRLALSGTPIENHLGELWSIFSFLMPGFLDTMSFFKTYYQTPIEKERSFSRQELLNKRIKPFMIRRTKELVASELPAKSEIVKYTQFENKQSMLYESIRVAMEEKVRQAVENKGLASSHITILDALLKLRQVCCDPSLLNIKEAQKVKESAKLELFLDLVDELLAEGRKILVFSQFTSMLGIIEEKIKSKNITYTKLTGSTIKREEAIEEFVSGDADIFLISLKAGGVGLNLVEADTVIHYDPWWNPAVENQATDRAYRIGQTKAVFVYKLIVENTIEQKILELQKKKQAIQDGIYDDNKQQDDVKFSGDELLELLK